MSAKKAARHSSQQFSASQLAGLALHSVPKPSGGEASAPPSGPQSARRYHSLTRKSELEFEHAALSARGSSSSSTRKYGSVSSSTAASSQSGALRRQSSNSNSSAAPSARRRPEAAALFADGARRGGGAGAAFTTSSEAAPVLFGPLVPPVAALQIEPLPMISPRRRSSRHHHRSPAPSSPRRHLSARPDEPPRSPRRHQSQRNGDDAPAPAPAPASPRGSSPRRVGSLRHRRRNRDPDAAAATTTAAAAAPSVSSASPNKRELSPRRPWDVLGAQALPDAASAPPKNGALTRSGGANTAVSPRPTFVSNKVADEPPVPDKLASPRGRRRHRHGERERDASPASPGLTALPSARSMSPTRALSPTRSPSTALPSITTLDMRVSGSRILKASSEAAVAAAAEEKRKRHRHRSTRHKSSSKSSASSVKKDPVVAPKLSSSDRSASSTKKKGSQIKTSSAPQPVSTLSGSGVVKAAALTGDVSAPDSMRVASLREAGASRKASDPIESLIGGSPSRLSDSSRITLAERLEREKQKLESEIADMRNKLAAVAAAADAAPDTDTDAAPAVAPALPPDPPTRAKAPLATVSNVGDSDSSSSSSSTSSSSSSSYEYSSSDE